MEDENLNFDTSNKEDKYVSHKTLLEYAIANRDYQKNAIACRSDV